MAEFDERPTVDVIKPIFEHYSDVWAATKANCIEADQYIGGNYPLWRPGIERPQLRSARGYSIVEGAANALVANKPVISRAPMSQKDESEVSSTEKARNDRIERFLSAVFDSAMLSEHLSPFRTLAWYLMAYGYGVAIGPTVELSEEPEEPEKGDYASEAEFKVAQRRYKGEVAQWNPFKIRSANPTEVLFEPFQKQSRFSLHIKHMKKGDLSDIASKMGGNYDHGGERFKQTTVVEYFCKKYHAMFTTNEGSKTVSEAVFIHDNDFGIVPHVGAFAGFGYLPVSSDQGNPSFMAMSIIKPVFEILQAISRAITSIQNAVLAAGFPRPGTAKPVEEAEEEYNAEKWLTGESADFWWMRVPDLPNYIFQQLAILLDDLESATFSRALTGLRQEGVSTVGQQMQLSSAALRKFQNPARQMDYVASVIAQNVLRAVDVLDKTITVRGQSISPEDIQGYYGVDVTFKLLDPLLQLQQRQVAMREVEMGLSYDEQYWETAGYQDATRMRMGTNMQMVRRDPKWQELLMGIIASNQEIQEFLGVEAGRAPGGLVDTQGMPLAAQQPPQQPPPPQANGNIPTPYGPATPNPGRIPLLNAAPPEEIFP